MNLLLRLVQMWKRFKSKRRTSIFVYDRNISGDCFQLVVSFKGPRRSPSFTTASDFIRWAVDHGLEQQTIEDVLERANWG